MALTCLLFTAPAAALAQEGEPGGPRLLEVELEGDEVSRGDAGGELHAVLRGAGHHGRSQAHVEGARTDALQRQTGQGAQHGSEALAARARIGRGVLAQRLPGIIDE